MSTAVNALWTDHFLPGLAPDWLAAFEEQPQPALGALLSGAYDLGVDNAMAPDELLVQWTLDLEFEESFVELLDEALSAWIRQLPGEDVVSLRRATGAACRVVFQLPELAAANVALRSWVLDLQTLLDRLATDATSEVVDDAMLAVTRSQPDRALAAQWWSLVRLAGDVPVDRGRIGILGIAGLPVEDGEQQGGFREDLAEAIDTLGDALHQRCATRRLALTSAHDRFVDALDTALRLNPFEDAWSVALGRRLVNQDTRTWASELIALTDEPKPSTTRNASAPGLRADRPARARDLLDESRALRSKGQEELAVRLSTKALEFDPWNVYSWTIHMRNVYYVRGRDSHGAEAALPVAWKAVERFPHNVVCWQELGFFLKSSQRWRLAEETWYECLDRFPNDDYALTNLADLLMDRQKVAEAGRLFARFPSEVESPERRGTRINYLRAAKHFAEAEAEIRPEIEGGSKDPYLWGNHIRVLRDWGKTDEAIAALNKARELFPSRDYFAKDLIHEEPLPPESPLDRSLDHPVAPRQEAAVMRRRLRRLSRVGEHEARSEREGLQGFIAEHLEPRSPSRAVVERSLLDIDEKEPERAVRELDAAVAKLGATSELRYAQHRAMRAEAAGRAFTLAEYRRLLQPLSDMPHVAVRPLRALGAVRSAHALNDGQELEALQFKSLKELDVALKTSTSNADVRDDGEKQQNFLLWWRTAVAQLITGEADLTTLDLDQATVADAEHAVRVHGEKLDGLEEDFVSRLEPALIGL